MTGPAWAALMLAATLALAALGDLVSEEIRGWLDLAPRAILRLAAAQLNSGQRETIYHDEWLPELTYALRGAESRPITRLIRGTAYALGLLIAAHRVARHITRPPADGESDDAIGRPIPVTETLVADIALGAVPADWDADRAVTSLYRTHYRSLVRPYAS
jgi:hypothetical protein